MKNKKDNKECQFDSFLNKTIILSSRKYFVKNAVRSDKERTIVDDENYSNFLQGYFSLNNPTSDFDKIELSYELKKALESLSAIEQSVIFLLFQEELTQNEAADILEIYSKTISKIKIRAISKLKHKLKGDAENEQ